MLMAGCLAPLAAPTTVLSAPRPACRDGRDNDRDRKVDFPGDPGCRSRRDRRERDPKPRPTPDPPPPPGGCGALGPGADIADCPLFPPDNPWNKDIRELPVDPDSAMLIASIGAAAGLHPDFGTVWDGRPNGIPYVAVPGNQAGVAVSFDYAEESDPGPYPIPPNPPIEGGADGGGDRHVLILDRDNLVLYELYDAWPRGRGWHAGAGAIFDLRSNTLRPAGWTSADAAGLPILPGLVRYDEAARRGEIDHALRFTAPRTRRAYLPPATHFASHSTDPRLPPMGLRVRLKDGFNLAPFPPVVQVILRALKRYGMFLADNGSSWYLSGAPDARWDDEALAEISRVRGSDFEVVKIEGLVTG